MVHSKSSQKGFLAAFPAFWGALAPILSPWTLVALLSLGTASFLYGLHIGNERLEAFQEAQEQVQQAHEAWARSIVRERKAVTRRINERHNVEVLKLNRFYISELDGMRDKLNQSSFRVVVPEPSRASGSSPGVEQRTCFNAEKVNNGVDAAFRRFIERLGSGSAAILQRGDIAREAFTSCAAWALDQAQVGKP